MLAATREFAADLHCGLEAYVGFPRIVLPGIHISLDVTWKQPCDQWLCQGFSKILPGVGGLPKPARLQGGISLKGFTFNVGFIGLDGQSVPSLGWKHKFEPIVLGVPNIKFPNITMPKLSWPKFTWPSLGKCGTLQMRCHLRSVLTPMPCGQKSVI